MATRFRQVFRALAPRWLTEGEGEQVLYSLTLVMDAFAERALQSLRARHVDSAPPDALPAMSRDRGIIRGFAEPVSVLRERLRGWLDVWLVAGNARTLMDQVAAYLFGHEVTLRVVTNNGRLWYTRDPDGTFSYEFVDPSNWDWDGSPEKWSRWWLVIVPPSTGLWTDMVWGDLTTWGETETWGGDWLLAQVQSIRSICRRFKPAGTRPIMIVIDFADAFVPSAAAGTLADGTWATNWDQESDPVVASRDRTARYWRGL